MDSYTRRNRHLPSVIPHAVSTGRKNDQVHLSPLASPAGSKNKRCLLKIYVTMVSLCFFCLAASLRACLYNEQALDLDAIMKEKNHLHTDDKHADNVKPAARTKTVDRTRQKSEIINNHSQIRHNPDKPTDGSNVSEKSKSFYNLENSAKRNDTNDQNDMQQEGSAYLTMYGAHRVQPALDQLPKWLKDYFQWHSDQVQNANNNTKYLVATCLDRDKCGGFSDRIRPLPYMLLVASRVDRVLCIYWTKPFKLEAFMKPPEGGMDWRCPADIESVIMKEASSRFQERMKHNIVYRKDAIIFAGKEGNSVTKYLLNGLVKNTKRYTSIGMVNQDHEKIDKALNLVNAYSYKGTMPLVDKWFHMDLSEHIYRVMFEPVDEIARSVNATMTRLGLVENQYTSVHVRARYPTGQLDTILGRVHSMNHDKGKHHVPFEGKYKRHLLGFAQNALECGMLLDANSKIFFSSDSLDLTEHVLGQEMKSTTGATITPVGIDGRSEIKHLEAHNSGSPVEHVDFYPMVEDLMILGGSKCVAHGVGSFGAFGAGLSGNRCRAIHRAMGKQQSCPSTRSLKLVMNVTDDLLIEGDKVSDSIDGRLGLVDGWFWPDVEKIQKCFKKGCTAEDVGEELARMSTELSRP